MLRPKESENVIVCVRCRPFNENEKRNGSEKVTAISTDAGSVTIWTPGNVVDKKAFTFDSVFDENSAQDEVYNATARRIVDATLNGFNGTVFVYGQTGTGKTFTMQGVKEVPNLRGIIPNSFNHIFDHIARTPQKKFLVRISFLEIYNEEIRDLLSKDVKSKLDLKENPDSGVYVKDLSAFVVKSVDEMDHLMNLGNKNRSVGATLMNAESSRSHCIFSITIESSEVGPDGKEHIVMGKLNLVDLAGSERQSKTGATGDRLKEATKINLSLSALGNCISALVDGKSTHIPYRDSKLTRLLQDSLGGNAKTLMIATMSPASYNYEESLSTLRYANRAKNIKNKPKINEDPKDAMLRQYQEEIKRLREQLEARKANGGNGAMKKVVKKVVKKKKGKSFRTRSSENNEVGDEDYDDNMDSDNEAGLELDDVDPEMISQLKAEIEAEKNQLLASKDIVEEEKQKIAMELERRAAELERERQERESLALKLKAMEDKLLMGGVNIFERVSAQERELQERELKLQEQQRIERELQRQLELKQEAAAQMEGSYATLQEEVDVKTKKLKKLWAKLDAAKLEISDLQDEIRAEREDLIDTVRQLSRELILRSTIIDNFIPPAEREKTEKRAMFNEEYDDYVLAPLTTNALRTKLSRSSTTPKLSRPVSQVSKYAMVESNEYRYRPQNVISLHLDLPDSSMVQGTYGGLESGRGASSFTSALQFAISLEDEMDNVDMELSVNTSSKLTRNGSASLMSSSTNKTTSLQQPSYNDNSMYPVSRNLIGQKMRYV